MSPEEWAWQRQMPQGGTSDVDLYGTTPATVGHYADDYVLNSTGNHLFGGEVAGRQYVGGDRYALDGTLLNVDINGVGNSGSAVLLAATGQASATAHAVAFSSVVGTPLPELGDRVAVQSGESAAHALSRGWSGGYMGVMEGPNPSTALMAGKYLGEAWGSTKQFGYDMIGGTAVDNARANWAAGDIPGALVWGAKSFADAAMAVGSLATGGVTAQTRAVSLARLDGAASTGSAASLTNASELSTTGQTWKTFADNDIFTARVEWAATRERGTGQTYSVIQRNDIDWGLVRSNGPSDFVGKTNADAATRGFAPELADGNFATLHHVGQDSRGALAEASTRYHGVGKSGQDALHNQFGKSAPNPYYPIDRRAFSVDTREYWQWRVQNR